MNKIQQPPIGIIITQGKEVIDANGGALTFLKHFERCLQSENSGLWYHKSRNRPLQDIAVVYIIVMNRVKYKAFYGGYGKGPVSVWMSWGQERVIDWPRMILAGPLERAPKEIEMRGFRGFRYIYEPLW